MIEFFQNLFNTSGFPPRWTCGHWTEGHGWLHILSDVAIAAAYAAIPISLFYLIRKRRDVPFVPVVGWFAAFIVCCGLTHLVEATLFWQPWYRLSGLLKLMTAVVSWITVVALWRVLPAILTLPGLARMNRQLKAEIAERKQAEEARKESEERLRFVAERSQVGYWHWDMEPDRLEWSDFCKSLFGVPVSEPISYERFLEIVHPEDRVATDQAVRACLDSAGRRDYDIEYRVVWPDGSVHWIHAKGSAVFEGGRAVRMAGIALDVTERKSAAVELRRTHGELQSVLSSITDGLVVLDKNWCYTYFSRQGAAMLGIDGEALIGKCVWDEFPQIRHTAFYVECHRAMETGQPAHFEEYYPAPIGKWIESNCYPSEDGLSVYFRDVTERQEYAQALRRSEERLRLATEASGLGIWVWQPDRDEVTWENDWPYEILGIDRGQAPVNATRFRGEIVHPDDAPRFDREVQATRRGGTGFYFKGRIVLPDGEVRWVEFDGKRSPAKDGDAVVLVGTAKNITGRELAEEALRIERGRLAIALTAGQMGVYDWSFKDDSVWWSPETYAVFGVTQQSFAPTRESLTALVHPDDRQGLWDHLQSCVRARAPFAYEFRIRHPDGGVRWIGNRARIEYDAAGGAMGCSGVAIDITRQKEIEGALIESRRTAENANQAKDRFLAVLSHELRTPLTPVLMAVDELEHTEGLTAEMRGELAMISRNIQLEIKLIDDLLDLSRITSGKVELKKESVDLNRVVLDVCAICRSQIQEKSLKLEFTPGGPDCVIPADAARLHQVLWNLLRNAVKFTPAHGVIRVSVQRGGADRCVVRVEDTGIGIPAEALPKIFNAFEQGEARITRQFGGLGLGLAISRALVELHGGSIRVESGGADQGALFVLELPAGGAGVAAVTAVPAAGGAESAGRLRVLLVEDHADTARTLRRLLTMRGLEVASAVDVAGGIRLAADGNFDLVVSDLGLPDGSGCDLMRALRAAGQEVPGIAMSGYGMEEDMRRSAEAGFARHLVKPVGISRLMEAIREVVAGQPAADTAPEPEPDGGGGGGGELSGQG